MIKTVVFDLDGTLVNSIFDLADSVEYALSLHGLSGHEIDEYYDFVGNGMEHLVRSAMGENASDDELYRAVRADFDCYYNAHCNDKTVAYDGISELIGKLLSRRIQIAVLSNKAEEYIGKILNKNFPGSHFAAAWGQRDGIARKPSGEGLCALLKSLGCEKNECVYIGDSEVDAATAKNAGVRLIAVLWGFRTKDELVAAGAERFAFRPDEITDMLADL